MVGRRGFPYTSYPDRCCVKCGCLTMVRRHLWGPLRVFFPPRPLLHPGRELLTRCDYIVCVYFTLALCDLTLCQRACFRSNDLDCASSIPHWVVSLTLRGKTRWISKATALLPASYVDLSVMEVLSHLTRTSKPLIIPIVTLSPIWDACPNNAWYSSLLNEQPRARSPRSMISLRGCLQVDASGDGTLPSAHLRRLTLLTTATGRLKAMIMLIVSRLPTNLAAQARRGS